jgi:hypothetical protein
MALIQYAFWVFILTTAMSLITGSGFDSQVFRYAGF